MKKIQAFIAVYALLFLNFTPYAKGEILSSEGAPIAHEQNINPEEDTDDNSQKFYDNFWDPR